MAVATIRADGKSAILRALAQRFAAAYGLEEAVVLAGIEEREKLGSTGFGRGVAIPHARIAGLNRPVAAFLRLEAPVLFDAADAMPVDLVFGLLSPEQALLTALEELLKVFRSPNPRLLLVLQPEQFTAKSVRLKLQLRLERVDHLERVWSSLWAA